MKFAKKRISLIAALMLILSAGLLGACTNNKPIDESKLPELGGEPQQSQSTAGTEQTQTEEQQPAEQQPSEQTDQSAETNQSTQAPADQGQATPGEPALSEAEALSIALAKVPGATENDIYSFARDYDDGRWIYEGEIRYGGLEYDFEIDATTGNILEWEIDN